jgi:light-harvesting complex 1 beta chain
MCRITLLAEIQKGSAAPAAGEFAAMVHYPQGDGMAESNGGMTDEEARSFHGAFIMGTGVFLIVAAVAHFLAWSWRPWL